MGRVNIINLKVLLRSFCTVAGTSGIFYPNRTKVSLMSGIMVEMDFCEHAFPLQEIITSRGLSSLNPLIGGLHTRHAPFKLGNRKLEPSVREYYPGLGLFIRQHTS